MNADHPISLLIWASFAAVMIILLVLLFRFLRKPENQHPMEGERERNIDEIRDEGANGTPPQTHRDQR